MMWNVMAADDEAYIREALQKLISWEKMGCSLKYVAEDGKKLIDRMKEEKPDIVITDIRMPGADGWRFVSISMKRIRRPR